MRKSDDPLGDFALWDDDREEKLNKRPRCDFCGEHISDDCYYEIGHEIICERCINGYKKYFDD